HPVVGVSWYEARAFCRWLACRGSFGEGWSVDLPSELEWEKAARGGFEIPRKPTVEALGHLAGDEPEPPLGDNAKASRLYPWGDKIDSERANYHTTGVGSTSAVGCFPAGASPYGCEELSGNVWEWTRSQYRDYPYPEVPEERRQRETFDDAARWVLRGGSFDNNHNNARCAARINNEPANRNNNVGFRVVFSTLFVAGTARWIRPLAGLVSRTEAKNGGACSWPCRSLNFRPGI
ncbi:MAG: formylglycine-generating enzyme family protein, partial [bacterium]|nr:formylglycine-generating enzyme family protein [bacterium]